jgi:hypothetical protein
VKTKPEMKNAEGLMKKLRPTNRWLWAVSYFFILTSTLCLRALGQSYSIDWFKVSGGGGASSGGVYAVSATIGQPDAGAAMSGGNYSLTGGFWSVIAAVPTPGAPTLTVTRSGSSAIVSWPYPSSGWALQQNPSLSTSNWTASGFTITSNASVNSITITAPAGTLFFRLAK